jgi:hypothetical protein
MKKLFLLLVIAGLVCAAVVYDNGNPAMIISRLKKGGPLKEGNLVYKIYAFGLIPVGYARINKALTETYNGRNVYHLSASAKSADYFSRFFHAATQLDSYIDPQTRNSVFFKQKVSVSNKSEVTKEITYDQQKGTMTMAGVKRQILPNTQDALSAIYNIMAIDLAAHKGFAIFLNTNQKNYIMEGSVATKEVRAAGTVFRLSSADVEIKRHDGNPHHKSKISITMLKDYGNIPILIKVFASGAMINAKLVKIE